MAIKLGTMLVQEGLISLQQLDEALKYQTIFGGRLGTNLIEMGLAEEEDIARILSDKLRVPFTGSEELLKIPTEVIQLIPRKIAQKYKVVPLRQEKKRLYLAMVDPSDLRAVDEIGFISGYAVHPLVAPEVSLILALEKHYGIDRDVRYVPVINQIEKLSRQYGRLPCDIEDADDATLLDPGDQESCFRRQVLQFFEKTVVFSRVRRRAEEEAARFDNGLENGGFVQRNVKMIEIGEFFVVDPCLPAVCHPVPNQKKCGFVEGATDISQNKRGRVICVLYVTGQPSKLTGEFFDLQKLTQKATLALDILILRNKIMMT